MFWCMAGCMAALAGICCGPSSKKRRHRTFAMDLPVDQPNTWMDQYADAALAAVEGKISDDVYLVGHSMGGMVIPRMAARLPKARLIFLCAGFAHTSEDEHKEILGNPPTATCSPGWSRTIRGVRDKDRAVRKPAIDVFYHDVPPDVAGLGFYSQLRPHWAEWILQSSARFQSSCRQGSPAYHPYQ